MRNFIRIFEILKQHGVNYTLKKILSKIINPQINNLEYVNKLFTNKSGLEVGGPSRIFQNNGFIPLYKIVKNLDGCNFSHTTIWEGNIKNGEKYNYFKNKSGIQYISEATDLSFIPTSKYDFIISSNALEHIANPMKAIHEWIRILKKGGLLLLVLPNKKYCFDHKRHTTEFLHLLTDFNQNTTENDLTHLNEILELHDLKRDKFAGSFELFKARSLKNFENRALHHHVFDMNVLTEIFNYLNLEVLLTHQGEEYIILGKVSNN